MKCHLFTDDPLFQSIELPEKITTINQIANEIYTCASCDEGMYQYPQPGYGYLNAILTPGYNTTQKYLSNYCVPDCSTMNFQMVNNPELGRCEFLGYYCMAGNYKEGCT